LDSRVWKFFLLGCGILMVFYLMPLSPIWESFLLVGIGIVVALAIIAGLRAYRPEPMTAWALMGSGQVFNTLGDIFFTQTTYLGHPGVPFEISAILYMIGIVLCVSGLAYLFFKLRRLIDKNAVLNGLIVSTGLASMVWILLVHPNLTEGRGPSQVFVSLGYPTGVLIIGVVTSIFLMTALGNIWSYRILFGVLLCYALGLYFDNVINSLGNPIDFSVYHNLVSWNDSTYSLAYILLGVAYLHPSMGKFRSSLPGKTSVISRMDLAVLGMAFFITPGAFLIQYVRGLQVDIVLLVISMTIIFTLVEVRLALIVRALQSQNRQLNYQREQLRHQAHHDPLTGLPNRFFLYKHLAEVIERSRQNSTQSALFMIDLDNFKQVNDTFGHDEGDATLRKIADRFTHLKRKGDIVTRWGGDEFVFVIEGLTNKEDAVAFARRMDQEVRVSVIRRGMAVEVALSIGICIFPLEGEDVQAIIKRADIALYRAKKDIRDKIAFNPPIANP
jgi:diguanylate cyclase (GGDEF)-like protein